MTAVYVLRHPETTWNATKRYQGRLESPPSDKGKQQAHLAAEAFAPGDLDAIFTSPLFRTRYLAERVAATAQAPLYLDQRLTEVGQGAWEGLHLHEIVERYPRVHEEWYRAPEKVTFPYGENLHEVRHRGASVLADVTRRFPNGSVALVTHSVMIQVLVCCALGVCVGKVHQVHVSNCGISTFCGTELDGSLVTLNSVSHLYGSPAASATAENCVSLKRRRNA